MFDFTDFDDEKKLNDIIIKSSSKKEIELNYAKPPLRLSIRVGGVYTGNINDLNQNPDHRRLQSNEFLCKDDLGSESIFNKSYINESQLNDSPSAECVKPSISNTVLIF